LTASTSLAAVSPAAGTSASDSSSRRSAFAVVSPAAGTSASSRTSASENTSARARVSSAATAITHAAAPSGPSATASCPAGSTVSPAIAALIYFWINSTGLIEAKERGNIAVKQGIGRTVIAASRQKRVKNHKATRILPGLP
jgi:hypothetical protein